MPKVSTIFSSQFLRAADLAGAAKSVRITGWREERAFGEDVYVLELAGEDCGLRLTSTLAHDIRKVLGTDEIEEWVGRWITIFPSKLKIFDKDTGVEKIVDTIRGGASDQDEGPKPRRPLPDDDIPF